VLTSPSCHQTELRADLRVRSLTVTPLSSGQDAYTAVIANRGMTAAGPVEVDLAGAGAGAGASAVGTLPTVGAGSAASYRFTGPACTAGSTLTVTVDPAHTVDEFNFANNVLTVPCPAPSSGPSGDGRSREAAPLPL
jgi:hypothetical protein